MDAGFLKDIMVEAFNPENKGSHNYYLMQPFTIFVSMNFNKGYTSGRDPYKY